MLCILLGPPDFYIFLSLKAVKWYLAMVYICISFITTEVRHLSMFISNSSTPLHNFCPLFYLFLLSFFLTDLKEIFKSSEYQPFVRCLLDLRVMSSSHDFSFHFSALNSYRQWPGRKLHLGISQVPQTPFVYKAPQTAAFQPAIPPGPHSPLSSLKSEHQP